MCLAWFGRFEECRAVVRLARADLESLPSAERAQPGASAELAQNIQLIGKLMGRTGDTDEAMPELRAALAIRQKLADDHPAVPQFP